MQNNFIIQAKELNEMLTEISEKITVADERLKSFFGEACFMDVEDVMKVTGFSKPTALALFNRPDFPSCDLGKKKIVLNWSFYMYFMHPVRAGEVDYEANK